MTESSNNEPAWLREAPPTYDTLTDEDIDLSLLADSLRLTPWQRLIENERALALVRMLEGAKIRKDGTAEPNS